MKDARFIELVNLYIDRQISSAETAELEAEIRDHPRHRQVYQQYCKLHRATKLVYESFRANAEQPAGNRPLPGTIARFQHRPRNRWVYAAGGLAAAACFTLILFRAGTFGGTKTGAVADAGAPAPAALVASALPAPAAITAPARTQPDYSALLASLQQEHQRTLASTQVIPTVSLFDDGVFDGKQALNLNNRRAAPAKKMDGRATAEFTGFQFQR